jgi:hypothetical protein
MYPYSGDPRRRQRLGETIEAPASGHRSATAANLIGGALRPFGALPAALLAGALSGAVFGGIGGRVLMRAIFVIEKQTKGAETDFGTVGEISFGGTITLLILSIMAGVMGGIFYFAVRRWLPWRSPMLRGAFFGLLMTFGPGVIFLGEVDLQIFEPAVPIFLAFVLLIVLYGIAVALLTDSLRPIPAPPPGPRMELAARALVAIAAVGIIVMAALVTYNVQDKAGTCLSAFEGSCAVRAPED